MDIVQLLRLEADLGDGKPLCARAADEIERLRRTVDEISLRTDPYREQWADWPLVAGINQLVRFTTTWKR